MRGDPTFDPDMLSAEARYWYDRLWDALEDPDIVAYATQLASRDDIYYYGRTLHTRIVALLTAFRATGDLSLLDEVDRLAEHMRNELADRWRGTRDGSDNTRDGFLNWVHRYSGSKVHTGKDIHEFDEMRTHSLVAQFTFAFHNNRDLTSPNGVDYGSRADAWSEYLLEHFEAKWRQRNDVATGRFPFLEHSSLHATIAFVKYHHYLGNTLESDRHIAEARRLTDLVLDHFVQVSVEEGAAYVWPRTLRSAEDDDDSYLQPTTYARYVVGDAFDLHLDGAYRWAAPDLARNIATSIRAFVLDGDGDIAFTRDIGGGEARGGIRASSTADWDPITSGQYAESLFALGARWDESGTIAARTCEIHQSGDGRTPGVHLPAAMLLAVGADVDAARSSASTGARP